MGFIKPPDDCCSPDGYISLADFVAVLDGQFVRLRTGSFVPGATIDKALPKIIVGIKPNGNEQLPTVWLTLNRRADQVTWMPGLPQIIEDRIILEGGWESCRWAHVVNLYKPSSLALGHAALAAPWVNHLRRIYPGEFEEIADWVAFKFQHPELKVNYALVLGGGQGIGKD